MTTNKLLQRRKLLSQNAKREQSVLNRKRRYYERVTSKKVAKCSACEKDVTVGELAYWARRYESKKNICHDCSVTREDDHRYWDDLGYLSDDELNISSADIFWRTY
jgi:hypothetical protein